MVKDLSRDDERRGTRRIMLAGSAVAAALFVGLLGWFATPHLLGTVDNLGRPPSGADRGTAATTIGTGVPTQREAESAVAKKDPAGLEDTTGGPGPEHQAEFSAGLAQSDETGEIARYFCGCKSAEGGSA